MNNEARAIPISLRIYLRGLVERTIGSLIAANAPLGCPNCDIVSADSGADRLGSHVRVC